MVVTLVVREQLREIERLHGAAGVDPARHHVTVEHPVVQEIATTGTPVPPPPPAPEQRPRPASGPPRGRRRTGRPAPRPASRQRPAASRSRTA
jgi:hypothetical protein